MNHFKGEVFSRSLLICLLRKEKNMSILNIKSYLCKQKHIMIEQIGNTGTRATGILLFGGELTSMIYDMKWMLIAIGLLIIADYRLGCE